MLRVIDVMELLQGEIAEQKRAMMSAEINPLINDIFAVERAAIKVEALERLQELIHTRYKERKRRE